MRAPLLNCTATIFSSTPLPLHRLTINFLVQKRLFLKYSCAFGIQTKNHSRCKLYIVKFSDNLRSNLLYFSLSFNFFHTSQMRVQVILGSYKTSKKTLLPKNLLYLLLMLMYSNTKTQKIFYL